MIENLTSKTIFLAKDKNSKTFVNQAFNDRLFNTFIIGETGCGKMNQIIIPMIKQDVDNSINNNCSLILLDPASDIENSIYEYTQKGFKPIIRFNPFQSNCPYYNPLALDEQTCIKNFQNMFLTLNPNLTTLEINATFNLIENSIKVIKRLYKEKANLNLLETLSNLYCNKSKEIVEEFLKTNTTSEDKDIGLWFTDKYFKEITGAEHDKYRAFCDIITQLNHDTYIGRILNPPVSSNTISLEELVINNQSVIITTTYGLLKYNGRILSALIMAEIQTAIFKRNIKQNPMPLFLYMHEAQEFINKDFVNLVTCGRSYNVGCVLSLQSIDMLNLRLTKTEKETVIANVRNTVLFPCVSDNDIKYFNPLFQSIVEKLDPKESTISKREFSEHDLRYRAFPEFICSLILNGRYVLPKICTPLEYK